jgi:predicted transcriptional regulator
MVKILCNNPWEGLCFMMKRALEKENLEVETKTLRDDADFFKKYKIRTCPVLLELDNDKVVGRITGIEEIVKNLKEDVQDRKV